MNAVLEDTPFQSLQTAIQSLLDRQAMTHALQPVRILVAFSGGSDSSALLHSCCRLRDEGVLEVVAGFYHHGWRGTPAPELQKLQKLTSQLRVPLVLIPPEPNEKKTEATARQQRYKKLTALAEALELDAVFTAHHADDQLETILYRLFRGTGVEGLSGIRESLILEEAYGLPVPILRPFLKVERQLLERYCQEHEIHPFEDPTNAQTRYARNSIRHAILPKIHEAFPSARQALQRLSHLAEEETGLLTDLIEPVWQNVIQPQSSSVSGSQKPPLVIDTSRFAQLGNGYQRQVTRRFLKYYGELSPELARVDDIRLFIASASDAKRGSPRKSFGLTLDGKPRYLVYYRHQIRVMEPALGVVAKGKAEEADIASTTLVDSWPEGPSTAEPSAPNATTLDLLKAQKPGEDRQLIITLPCAYDIPWLEGKVIVIQPVRGDLPEPLPSPEDEVQYVNLMDFQDKPLVFRRRQPGDRIRPMGFESGRVKLKDFLMSRRIPSFERDRIDVLATEQQILWIPGMALSESLRATAEQRPTHTLRVTDKEAWEHLLQAPKLPEPLLEEEDDDEDESPSPASRAKRYDEDEL